MAHRPLSPHVSVYRITRTFLSLSIVHRATGMALSGALLLLVAWLVALASGPDAYGSFAAFAGHWAMKVVLGAVVISFCYHLANGIRHLCWDLGWGLERRQARISGRVVVISVLLVSALLLWLFLGRSIGATP